MLFILMSIQVMLGMGVHWIKVQRHRLMTAAGRGPTNFMHMCLGLCIMGVGWASEDPRQLRVLSTPSCCSLLIIALRKFRAATRGDDSPRDNICLAPGSKVRNFKKTVIMQIMDLAIRSAAQRLTVVIWWARRYKA
jgi:hypothetical protein